MTTAVSGQIADLRQVRGLTQAQLAAASGCTQSQISRIESGTLTPTLTTIERIAAALSVRMDITLH